MIETSRADLAASHEDSEVVFLPGSCAESPKLSATFADPAATAADARFFAADAG